MDLKALVAKFGNGMANFWTNLVSGAAAIGAALILGSADWKEGVPWEQAIPFLAATGVWIGSEFARWNSAQGPSPHDLKLSRKLRSAFNERTRRFLREHSFGLVFHESKTKGLELLNHEWQGVDHEFEDPKLKLLGDQVTTKLETFLNRMVMEIGVADRYPATSYSVPTDRERAADTFEEHTRAAIRDLDRMASELLASYEEFERAFRRKAPAEFA